MSQKNKRILLSLLLILALSVGGVAHAATVDDLPLNDDAYETLMSIQKVDEDFYCVEYYGDYMLDAIMETGAAGTQTLGEYISQNLLHGLPFQRDQIWLACSSFAAETTDGDFIQGRNMDYALAQNILVRTRPENGYASIGMASGAMLGYFDDVPENLLGQMFILAAPYYVMDGINEEGLSMAMLLQTYDEVVHQDTGKPPMTTTMAIRMVLDHAATVDEAIALMSAYIMSP